MTSKRSLRTFGARIAKVVFSFSLILGTISWGAPNYGQLDRTLQDRSDQEVLRTLRRMKGQGEFADDPVISRAIERARLERDGRGGVDELRALVQLRAIARGESNVSPPEGASVSETAKEIKSSPFYRDQGVKEQTNWLAGALARLENIDFQCNQDPVEFDGPRWQGGSWLIYIMWGVLGLGVGLFVYFALRHFKWIGSLERRAKALLDEDEPERTVDEWLTLADDLERQGRNREAVRCLYLACLLRIDEARIARFDRGQTNWEHLIRIERSPKTPADLDFRPPTKSFDVIWYGMRPATSEHVAQFRSWYQDVLNSVRRQAA